MSNASEHYHALADESAVAAGALRILQEQSLDECATYEPHTVGGRVWARIAVDMGRLAREWDRRVQQWQASAAELTAAERRDPDTVMQANAAPGSDAPGTGGGAQGSGEAERGEGGEE